MAGALDPYPRIEPTIPVAVLATPETTLYTADIPRIGRDPAAA